MNSLDRKTYEYADIRFDNSRFVDRSILDMERTCVVNAYLFKHRTWRHAFRGKLS
jgi:hypothetical protein